MIWDIVKKQSILFIRNPQQLILLLMLPIILICILSVSLSGFISGETFEIDAKIAMIEHTDEKEQIERFIQEVENSKLSEVEKKEIGQVAKNISIVHLLKDEAFADMDKLIDITMVSPEDKATVLADDSFAAVIEIPKDFTYNALNFYLLKEGNASEMKVYQNESKTLQSNIVKSIIDSFQEQMSMMKFTMDHHIDPVNLEAGDLEHIGTVEPIGKGNPVSSKQYYTIGMAVMNVLYVATAVGVYAFIEKQTQVFNRVILANVSRWTYFSGIFVSGVSFALIQLLIIFGFSWIVYGVTWPILQFLLVTVCLAFAVGALSVLLTSISYRINSESVINFFSNFLVALLALLGGSFFPIGDIADVFQLLGDFTPNGASMSAYLSLLRGDEFSQTIPYLIYLLLFTFCLLLVSIFSFPKRGQI
ncbi:ABC transporter permease [Pseudogracilibacillus sp. SE30717A]|uniref:ABC transporter permease n=1 Tax=Pseudogracilibacillus sp. SE30717A TaxID=3098293 RepID=UPI00300E15B2